MARAQLIITAVVVEGRSKTEVARDYGSPATGCSSWSAAIGVRGRRLSAAVPAAAVQRPRSQRPHHSPYAPQAHRPASYAAHQQLPPITAHQQRPQPESRLAAGHPQGRGLDPGERAATLTDQGQQP